MNKFALINKHTGLVENVAVFKEDHATFEVEGYIWFDLKDLDYVGPGYVYDGSEFKMPEPEVIQEEENR